MEQLSGANAFDHMCLYHFCLHREYIRQRFLNGSDEYRAERLKVVPVVVEGPSSVKQLVPDSVALPNGFVPVRWIKRKEETDIDGTTLCPMFEVELDLMALRSMRFLAGIVFKKLKSLVVDIAIVIQKEGEPSACIAMWRFNKIDYQGCPRLPPRELSEAELWAKVDAYLATRSSSGL
jgi:hypothetical protein